MEIEVPGRHGTGRVHGPPVCLDHGVFGPSTQDQAGRVMSHLSENTLGTCHPTGILQGWLANHPAPVGYPAALEEMRCGLHHQWVHDGFDADTLWCPEFFTAVYFESQSLTEDIAAEVQYDGRRHGDV